MLTSGESRVTHRFAQPRNNPSVCREDGARAQKTKAAPRSGHRPACRRIGWRYSADQVQKHIPQQSPIANLFLCGHWVEPGGGVNNVMTGGLNAADLSAAYLEN